MDWSAFFEFGAGPHRHGAASIHDGVGYGISPRRLSERASREGWTRPYPGVLYLPGSADSFWRRHAAAMLAVAGRTSVTEDATVALARYSAAYSRGLLDHPKPLTELTRCHSARVSSRRDVTIFRSRRLGDDDVSDVEGLACTTAARTLRDLAFRLNLAPLRSLALHGIQLGHFENDDLVRQVDTLGGGPTRRRFERLIEQLGTRKADSPFEWEVREALEGRGHQPWPEPFRWRCRDGVVVSLDIAFPWAWFAIECDGRGKYRLGADFTTDRVRWSEVNRDWRLLWLDWTRWERNPDAVLDDIEERLAEADLSRPPAQPAAA
jgi:hypothetical protein